MTAEVEAFLETYSGLVARGDWEAVGQLYADDPRFLWVEDGQVRYTSAAEIRAALASVAGMFGDVSTEFVSPSIVPLAPGLAAVATLTRQRFGEGEAAVRFDAAITMLLIRTPDGWRMLRGHTSTQREETDV